MYSNVKSLLCWVWGCVGVGVHEGLWDCVGVGLWGCGCVGVWGCVEYNEYLVPKMQHLTSCKHSY